MTGNTRADAHLASAMGVERYHLDDEISPTETTVAATLIAVTFVLRVVYVFHYRIDSDEPQHLHVVWAWVQGLLQYRDVFDNHAPLFHLLLAPVLALVGERPDVVPAMRLTMLPLYALAVCCTYVMAATLFSRRVALWTAVLALLSTGFFLISLEFRADDLWAALWLLALAVLVRGRATPWRCLGAGVLLGATLAVSLKTVMLLTSAGIAALAAATLVDERDGPRWSWPGFGIRALALLAGLALVPASLIALFAFWDALPAMYYGTVGHNMLPGLGLWNSSPARIFLVPIAIPPLWMAARAIGRAAPTAPIARRRVLVFLTTGIFFVLLLGVWPLVTREDFLPVDPLAVMLATGLLLTHPPAAMVRTSRRRNRLRLTLPITLAVIDVLVLVLSTPPWRNDTQSHASMLAAVLRLTAPTDYVMDVKGEAVFRPRPFFYGLEQLTKTRLKRGLIVDDIAKRLVATRTAVVTLDQGNFPQAGRTFMNDNYLSVGAVRVLGRFLAPEGDRARFAVAIPASYAIVTDDGQADGLLDGTPYTGPRPLEIGEHEFVPSRSSAQLALVWAPAVAYGFSPFGIGGARDPMPH